MQKSTSKKIDYLIVLPTDSLGGGAEQLLFNVTEYLSNQNFNCTVIFLSKKNSGQWAVLEKKCTLRYLPYTNHYLGYLALLFLLIKFSFKYRISHTFTSQTLINALVGFSKKIGLLRNTKIIVRESNSIFHLLSGFKLKMYAMAYRLGYSGTDLVICQTDYMKNELFKALPWIAKKSKFIVLNNPVNLDLIQKKSILQIEKALDFDYLIAAGRLSPVKGFDILIKAFKKVSLQFPELKLLILGEGNEREFLENLINDEKMNGKIELVGFVKNVYPYFKAAKLCVMSSRIEGFPNVLLQMMSQNTKVVSTLSAGGIDRLEGVYTCETNPEAVEKAILRCLYADTTKNRVLFDNNLEKRTLKAFIEATK